MPAKKKSATTKNAPADASIEIFDTSFDFGHAMSTRGKINLKLTPDSCLQNIDAVIKLIRGFSDRWYGGSGPDWLNSYKNKSRNPCFYLFNRNFS